MVVAQVALRRGVRLGAGRAVTVNLSGDGVPGTFGRNGEVTVTVALKDMNKNGAVLKITSSLPPG
ncbi:hypothetical protein [Streptomyces sp. NBC_01508]|uniref:hypothetical protein n=1 Tax=Streptomyces sp. NBC_01508 TaxID=2903888 RepID=UPI00386CF8CD